MYKPIEQIEKEYDGLWVFLANLQKDEFNSVIGGELRFL